MKLFSDYDNFAWLYDREWSEFARVILPLLKDITGDKLPDGARVLDLCCGTVQLAKVLTEKGHKVTGIDGSAEMLHYAKINAPDAEFTKEDARTFKLPSIYDAVFSAFNSLNHILKTTELLRTFKNTYKCLVNGGIFIFDLNTERTFEKGWNVSKDIKETPNYFYATRGDYNKENKIAQLHITMFQREAKGWQHSDLILQQTFFPNIEVKSALKKAGFTGIRTYSASRERGLHKPTRGSFKIFYYARKS